MKAQATILGTASMMPTKDRNLTSVFFQYKGNGILFDCGEGTQRQMKIAGIKPNKINKILITHWHGDHVLGLPGLLQTIGNNDYEGKLEIYGPKGTRQYLNYMLKGFIYDSHVDMEIKEVEEGIIFENDDFYLETQKVKHGARCQAYAFREKDKRKMDKEKIKNLPGPLVGKLQREETVEHKGRKIKPEDVSWIEKGKKVAFITDTEICDGAKKISKDADVLLCEATYLDELQDKGKEYKHMTAKQAALLASNNNVEKLVLCHFSGRYKSTEPLKDEAREVFPNTVCAYDLMKIKL